MNTEEIHSNETAEEHTEGEIPPYALHSVDGIVLATLIGSVFAGNLVIAINFFRLGKKPAAITTTFLSIAGLVLILLVVGFRPKSLNISNVFVWICTSTVMFVIAKTLLGESIKSHSRSGGKIAPAWQCFGIGSICLSGLIVLCAGYSYLSQPSLGELIKFGKNEIYISRDATVKDAEYLAEFLEEIQYFDPSGENRATVKLMRDNDKLSVSLVVIEGAWEKSEVVGSFQQAGQLIIEDGFCPSVTIHLCNSLLEPQKTIRIK